MDTATGKVEEILLYVRYENNITEIVPLSSAHDEVLNALDGALFSEIRERFENESR